MAGTSTQSSPLACCKAMSRVMKVPERPTPALERRERERERERGGGGGGGEEVVRESCDSV